MQNKDLIQEARRMLCLFLLETAKQKGITQEQIAELTGFTQSNISRMLAGKYSPSVDNFLILAKSIGVNFFIESKDSQSDNNQWFEDQMKLLGRRQDYDRSN